MKPTHERWPHYGIRINPHYPFVEGEVRYAVHHEYAQTALDFLSRRSRLSFLNASAALDALPRVIQIMGEELGWSKRRRREEHNRAAEQLLSMGIQPSQLEFIPMGWREWILTGFGVLAPSSPITTADLPMVTTPSRAIFSPGEIETMSGAFIAIAGGDKGSIAKCQLHSLIKVMKGFESIKDKQIEYVLREAGLQGRPEFDCNEFLEVCGNTDPVPQFSNLLQVCSGLKEVVLLPEPSVQKIKRRTIPVEKSGGGV